MGSYVESLRHGGNPGDAKKGQNVYENRESDSPAVKVYVSLGVGLSNS